jgi:hypothetical protein
VAQQAQDTFVAVLADGSERLVTRGEVLPDSNELVKRDAKSGAGLFRPLDIDGAEPPPVRPVMPPAAAPVKVKAE